MFDLGCYHQVPLIDLPSACFCAGFRIYTTLKFLRSYDVLYVGSEIAMWNYAEMVFGFIILCLPSMRKLFAQSPWLRKIATTFRRSTKPTSYNSASRGDRFPTMNRRKKPSTLPASLFTDSDEAGFVHLNNFSTASGLEKGASSTQNDNGSYPQPPLSAHIPL
jgi:hypothetical protein